MANLKLKSGTYFGVLAEAMWYAVQDRTALSDNSLPDDVRAGMRTAAAFANMFIELREVQHG